MIVDDCEVFRAGLKQVITRARYAANIKDTDRGSSFHNLIDVFRPTLLFLSVDKNGSSDLAFLAGISHRFPATRLIALYGTGDERFVQQLYHLNTHAIVHRDAPAEEFLTAMEQVILGDVFYCQHTLTLLATQSIYAKRKGIHIPGDAIFTPREKQIITLICKECTAKEIADKLILSKRTVENTKLRIQEKMHAKNSAGIVGYAYRFNLIKDLF